MVNKEKCQPPAFVLPDEGRRAILGERLVALAARRPA
jgi:hypothetical protein